MYANKYTVRSFNRSEKRISMYSISKKLFIFGLMQSLPDTLLAELSVIPQWNQADFLSAHDKNSVNSIRLNTEKVQQVSFDNISISQVPWCVNGRYLETRPAFYLDPLWHAGAYYVQEASSMFIWHILEQECVSETALKVLDLCAAPGGKTTLLASYFQKGLVVSNEVIKTRASILVENTTKWGTGNVVVSNNDPKHFAALAGFFDVMLIDAPCSGSGLFRKDASWREGWSEENVELCCQRQKRILADAWPALSEGGLLMYATCSYSRAEDEDIVDWICENLDAEPIRIALNNDWNIVEVESEKKGFGYRFFPHLLKGEGFFVTVFRKKSTPNLGFWNAKKLNVISKKESAIIEPWLADSASVTAFYQGDNVLGIDTQWAESIGVLQEHLYLRKAGFAIGQIKTKGMVPAADLALSTALVHELPTIELGTQDAVSYLRRQDFDLPNPDNFKGWVLISYQNVGLGWIKALPNRFNNYYPIEWRILKQE